MSSDQAPEDVTRSQPDPEIEGAAPDVTVIIPVYNGERYLAEVLDGIAAQDYPGVVETLVIDSGSEDASLDIVRARPAVRLHVIPNAEFGHGRTRNLGVTLARGAIVAFLTQDATPATPSWLRELTAPLAYPGVAGVVGRQVARPHAPPLIRYDIARSFDAQGPRDRVTLYEADGPAHTVSLPAGRETPADGTPDATRRAFYSDVNSAARRAILCDAVPLRDVPYAEDIAYARDILAAGYRKAYAPAGLVVHSNDVTVRGYCRRMIEETRGLQDIGEQVPSVSLPGALARAARAAARDALRLLRDPAYPRLATCRWLLVNPAYHCARWLGIWRGSRP